MASALALGCGGRPVPFTADAGARAADAAKGGSDGGIDRLPTSRPCASDGPPRVTLAAIHGGEVILVSSDGSTRSVYRFDPYPPPSGVSFTANLALRGGNVVATATWWDAGDDGCAFEAGQRTCPETDRAVLLDLEGRVRWEKRLSIRTSSVFVGISARLGDQGWTTLSGGVGGVLVAPDGGETALPPEARGGRPFAGPAVPARLLVPETAQTKAKTLFAWWKPGGPVAPTEPPIELPSELPSSGEPFDAGDELDFLGVAPDGAVVIVHAKPDLTVVLPDRLDVDALRSPVASGPWRAVDDGTTFLRFNLATGQSDRFTWALPPGLRALGPSAVGHDGSLLRALRDDDAAAAFVSSDGASLNPIGRLLGQVETVSIQDFAGTYLVIAKGINDFFVPRQQWADAGARMPELFGASIQLVRPSIGLAAVITPAWYPVKLSSDGLCAAYWETAPVGARLTIHDLAQDTRTRTLETHAAWPPAFGFIE